MQTKQNASKVEKKKYKKNNKKSNHSAASHQTIQRVPAIPLLTESKHCPPAKGSHEQRRQ
jgi:hypothetical protein